MSGYDIRFVDKILDNVHGFIEYTAVEKEIIEDVYKRQVHAQLLPLNSFQSERDP